MQLIRQPKKNRKLLGQEGEQQALEYLQKHGLKLIEVNYLRAFGEIDLIMQDRSTIVFVEVRSRLQQGYGDAAESITPYKQRRLTLAALAYLQRFKKPPECRFDVVAIDDDNVTWLKNVMQGF